MAVTLYRVHHASLPIEVCICAGIFGRWRNKEINRWPLLQLLQVLPYGRPSMTSKNACPTFYHATRKRGTSRHSVDVRPSVLLVLVFKAAKDIILTFTHTDSPRSF